MIVALHVEDDALIARSIARLLSRLGVDVVSHQVSARDAIDVLAAVEVDVIICDGELAEGTHGADVLAYVAAHRPHLLSRFIFLSSHDLSSFGVRSLIKPCAPALVAAAVKEALS